MISILKKFRQKLLVDNKVGAYMLYAVGEIALVMIGILLALQVNAYQNERMDRQTERTVLNKLKQDLNKDLVDLQRLYDIKEQQEIANTYALEFFADPAKEVTDTARVLNGVRAPFSYYTDNPNRTAFQTATSSGNLFKLTNETLLDLLSFYFSDNNMSQFVLTTKNISNKYASEVYNRKYRLVTDSDYKHLFENGYFKDFVMENYYLVMKSQLKIGKELIAKKIKVANQLIRLIDHDIDLNTIPMNEQQMIIAEIVEANSSY